MRKQRKYSRCEPVTGRKFLEIFNSGKTGFILRKRTIHCEAKEQTGRRRLAGLSQGEIEVKVIEIEYFSCEKPDYRLGKIKKSDWGKHLNKNRAKGGEQA